MKVRVKQGSTGFIYGKFRTDESPVFDLVAVKKTDGSDEMISAQEQFSEKWMEQARRKPGPKSKAELEAESE